jgi:GT2 family glycosyltransferase
VTRVSAIVPATNDPPTLERCLSALRAADDAPDELVVVETAAAPGPAAARNEGAARATGEVLLFVDADVVVHRDAVAWIRRAFEADPSLAAIFGSYDDEPGAPGVVSGFRNLLHHHVHHANAGPVATFWAGLGAVRREPFEAAGGFDAARYPRPSVEDVELGLRISGAGGRIRLDPAVRGTHLKSWTLGEMLQTDFAHRGVPWAELLLEHGGAGRGQLNLAWRHRASALVVAAAAVAVVARRPRAAALALAALVGLNAQFYALLLRRRGAVHAAAGVGLHAVHHLAGIAAVPVGLARWARRR